MSPNELGAPRMLLPHTLMYRLCHEHRGFGAGVVKLFPWLEKELRQADIEVQKELYGTAILATFLLYFLVGFALVWLFAAGANARGIVRVDLATITQFSLAAGALLGSMFGSQVLFYPKVMLKKKVRDLERNLVFALRTVLVEVRSGITLYDAVNIVANGNNGQVSTEFKKAVNKINTGAYQIDALEELAENNPSLYFRRAIWQLVNGLKAGSDVSQVMESLVETISTEKSNQIRRYGNSLKLLSLLYMMLGAIIPALGLTFLIILSTFPQVKINENIFWGMLVFLLIAQLMFIGIIKNSRPSLLGG